MSYFQQIVKRIARESGSTPENVIREMQIAIDAAYNHHDPSAQPLWDRMAFPGERPTPEAFIEQITKML